MTRILNTHVRSSFVRAALFLVSLLSAGAAPESLLHKPAPVFIRPDLSGKAIDLAAYKGQVVLLNFWATWCAPCQIEMPRFVAWRNRFGPQGLQVIGVSMDDEDTPVRSLVRRRGISYPMLMGDEKIGEQYGGIFGLPVTFLIDRTGNVAAVFKGETSLPAMERKIQSLLQQH